MVSRILVISLLGIWRWSVTSSPPTFKTVWMIMLLWPTMCERCKSESPKGYIIHFVRTNCLELEVWKFKVWSQTCLICGGSYRMRRTLTISFPPLASVGCWKDLPPPAIDIPILTIYDLLRHYDWRGRWEGRNNDSRNTRSSFCLCQMTHLLGACVVRGALHFQDLAIR
ncbi:hypothetical protein B0T09DRAFT_183558 [Sordaria sp. MPI-SDFR-AT-0083]|nr:hypothetical protein B0T09DRAFT_183558 [Sordaria sp. MPI-SDFR-AT-0083]